MTRMPRRLSHSQRLLLVVLALLVVAAQALALAHSVVHSPVAQASDATCGAQHWSKALFGSHDDDSGCRLLDGAGHHAPPALPPILALHVMSLALAVAPAPDCPRAQPWPFQARGPPALR